MTEYMWHVDEEDRPIGKVEKKEMREKRLLHRSSNIFVRDSKGRMLVHKRTLSVDLYPGYYDIVVGGGIHYGEDASIGASRELKEEIGATTRLEFMFKDLYKNDISPVWNYYYETIFDGPLKLQESEVEWAEFMEIDEIKAMMKKEKFMPDSVKIFPKYLAFTTSEMVDVVDKNDKFIRSVSRSECDNNALLRRSARVIIKNSQGEWLIQQRSANVRIYPLMWDFGVSETVSHGETYEAAALRGTYEEMSIELESKSLKPLFRFHYASKDLNRMIMVFSAQYDGKIKFDMKEICEARFVTEKEMNEMMRKGLFTDPSLKIYDQCNKTSDDEGGKNETL